MGRAHVLIHSTLRETLRKPELAEQIRILSCRSFDDGVSLALVSSDHLSDGYHGQKALVVEGLSLRFADDRDT